MANELIDRFVRRVDVLDSETYRWQLDITEPMREAPLDAPLTDVLPPVPEAEPQEILRLQVTADDAAAYCAEVHIRFFRAKWTDKIILITI